MFCETRALAQEWTYRFLGAATAEHYRTTGTAEIAASLPRAEELPAPEPTTAEVRAWARTNGLDVPDRGRLRPEIWVAFCQTQSGDNTEPG